MDQELCEIAVIPPIILNLSREALIKFKAMVFNLKGAEYIELIKLLKLLHLAESGGHAKMMVDEGEVKLNGKTESRKRAKLRPGDLVETSGKTISIDF